MFRKDLFKAVEGSKTRTIVLSMIHWVILSTSRRLKIFEPEYTKFASHLTLLILTLLILSLKKNE